MTKRQFLLVTGLFAGLVAALLTEGLSGVSLGRLQSALLTPALNVTRPVWNPQQARVTNAPSVTITLASHAGCSEDLHVVEPGDQDCIFRGNRLSPSGGEFSELSKAQQKPPVPGRQRVAWPSGIAPLGEYRVYVQAHGSRPRQPYLVVVRAGNKTLRFQGSVPPNQAMHAHQVGQFRLDATSTAFVSVLPNRGEYWRVALMEAGWTSLAICLIALGLLVGESRYLRRGVPPGWAIVRALLVAIPVGGTAGYFGQIPYGVLGTGSFDLLCRAATWAILGAVAGLAIALAIPYLTRTRGFLGGLLGGGVGGAIYALAAIGLNDPIGRIFGIIALAIGIALMVELPDLVRMHRWQTRASRSLVARPYTIHHRKAKQPFN